MTTTSATGQRPTGLTRLATAAIARLQRLSDRVHRRGDALARERRWEITRTTGRLGISRRYYRDPRFAARASGTAHSQRVPTRTDCAP
jgi:hypothetical protein